MEFMEADGYNIVNCDETFLMGHADEFSALCVRAFAEHKNRNVNMGPCAMTPEKWRRWAVDCIGVCMMADDKIVAFWLARPDYKTKEVDGRILAVDPEYKGRHLGKTLSLSFMSILRSMGMNVFNTDTSMKTPHVVKFHKNYGCKAVGLASWSNTNYYSVLLRLALNPEFEISDEEAERRFKRSARLCKLIFNEDGSRTMVGKLHFHLIYAKSIISVIVHRFLK